MSQIKESPRIDDISTDDPDAMVHYEHPWEPNRALCGAPILGIPQTDDTPLDCVVCHELYENWED